MITYYLFKLLDDFVNKGTYTEEDITDEALIEYSKYCTIDEFKSVYSRGERNYININVHSDTTTPNLEKLKIAICKKNIDAFKKIVYLASRLEKVDIKKRTFELWLNHLCYCNNIKYKKIK